MEISDSYWFCLYCIRTACRTRCLGESVAHAPRRSPAQHCKLPQPNPRAEHPPRRHRQSSRQSSSHDIEVYPSLFQSNISEFVQFCVYLVTKYGVRVNVQDNISQTARSCLYVLEHHTTYTTRSREYKQNFDNSLISYIRHSHLVMRSR